LSTKSTGKWFKDLAKQHVGDEASKVALARLYAFDCREQENLALDPDCLQKAQQLCGAITQTLKLPKIRAERTLLLADSNVMIKTFSGGGVS
jgi:hypothetical protein